MGIGSFNMQSLLKDHAEQGKYGAIIKYIKEIGLDWRIYSYYFLIN